MDRDSEASQEKKRVSSGRRINYRNRFGGDRRVRINGEATRPDAKGR